MKNLLSIVAALFFVTVVAQAQINLTGDPYAVVIGTSITQTHVEIEVAGSKKGTDIANEVLFWRTSQGQVVSSVTTTSIAPTVAGDIDQIPTKQIYRQIATAAVAEAVRLQHITISGPTKVFYYSSVDRNGTGMATHFDPCTGAVGVARDYTVTFDNGVATIVDNTTAIIPSVCNNDGGIQ